MKESFYKFQYPITKKYLGFTDVELEKKNDCFRIKVIKEFKGKELLPEYTDLHYARNSNDIISVCFAE